MTARMTLAATAALLATTQAFASGPNEYSIQEADATITYGTTTYQQPQGTTTYQQPQGTMTYQPQGTTAFQGQNDVYQTQPAMPQDTTVYGTTQTGTTGGFGEIVYDSQPSYQQQGTTQTYAPQPSTTTTYDQYGQPVVNESDASYK